MDGVVGMLGEISDYRAQLYESEREYVAGAVRKRQIEYATGRHYARKALRLLGRRCGPIGVGLHRNPEWPVGVIGSISHSDHLAVVVVADLVGTYRGVGVDIEVAGRVSSELHEMLLTQREQKNFMLTADAEVSTTLIFSAKEAVFKAVFPLVGLMIGFEEVEIVFVPGTRSFFARYVGADPANAILERGRGQFVEIEDHILSWYFIEW